MATVKIDLSLEDTRGSIKRRKTDVENLNRELEKTKQLSTGTQTGSRAVKSSYSAALGGSGEGTEYGRARGSMGATGASGRDFANQAQGLGGLVRLYATYAANVFAVSAAFNALSQAMNTTNMVKGLDQLGAASGVALGSLAKRFEQASGGAISLRESMEATAKAVSSGLTQEQFLKLGDVAKKASQALGVNMSDAVSRLTRGITKLEPELLDELGIFTKVGKATEDYARSVGKSAEALTDFERRQAFANAVLLEGAQKFGEIQIDTNPYDKLLATLKNVAQGILEVVNKEIVPLVSLLASSPAALTLGIAALGSMIVKQAIPAIGEYRKSLREAAATSKELADQKLQRAESAAEARRSDIQLRSDAAAKAADDKVDALEKKLREQSSGRVRKDVQKILDPTRNILEIKDTEIDKLDKIGSKLKTQDNIYKQLAQTIREAKQANIDYIDTANKLDKERQEKPGRASTLGVLRAEAEAQRKSAASSSIISQAGDTASINGFKAAYAEMIAQIKTEKLGAVRGTLTGIAGAANAAATRLGGLVNAFSGYLAIITVAIAIYQLLSGWLSDNAEQQAKLTEAVETGNEAVKTLNSTYDKYRTSLTSDAVIATATAFINLSEGISQTVKALEAAYAKAGNFDRFIDGIKSVFGKGLKAEFGKGIAYQVSEGLKGITDPKLKKSAEDKLKELLNTSTLTSKAISGALDDISNSEIIAKGKSIAQVFDEAARASQKTVVALKAVQDGFTALDKSYTTLANSLVQKDPLSEFGKDLSMQGFNLAEAFKDPIASVSALRDILTDVSKIKLLAPESQQILMQNRDAFIALANSAEFYQQQIAANEKNIRALEAKTATRLNKAPIQRQIAEEQGRLSINQSRLQDTRAGLEVLSKEFARASELSIKKGFELIERSFARAMAESVLSSQKTLVDMLPKTAGTIQLSTQLENQKIDLQIQEITETQRLIKEMELLPLRIEKALLNVEIEKILANETSGPIREAARNNPRLKQLEEREKVLTSKNIGADVRSGKLATSPETQKAMQEQQGALAKITALANQKQMNLVKATVDTVAASYTQVKRDLDNDLKNAQQEREAYMMGDEFRADSLQQQQLRLKAFTETETTLKTQLGLLDAQRDYATVATIEVLAQQRGWTKVAEEAGKATETAKTQLQIQQKQATTSATILSKETDRKNELELQLAALRLQNVELDTAQRLSSIDAQTSSALLDIQKQDLQLQLERGIILDEEYMSQIKNLETIERAKQRDVKLTQLQLQYSKDMTGYAREFAEATAAQRPEIEKRYLATVTVYNAEVDSINKVYEATEKLKISQGDLTHRQMAYTDAFKSAFKGMEDAIVEFTKTGKLSFSSMIESFLEDLLRYEIRQQQMMLLKGFGGASGIVGAAMNAFGIVTGQSVNPGTGEYMGSLEFAKGGAFDYGVEAFAKGGAFTNQIVDSPTLFKFAKGTGLMGEAGPEAIMPLTRDNSGNLGVRAQGGGSNVEVVVNNYSTAKAETKETTDSRGNRRIEVVVGDMVAQEVARTGSATQNAFSSTYGTRPALARR